MHIKIFLLKGTTNEWLCIIWFENKDPWSFVIDLKDQVLALEDEKSVLEIDNKKLLSAPTKGKDLANIFKRN